MAGAWSSGRKCLAGTVWTWSTPTAAWPADAVLLDAYDHPAGAGAFYTRCGFRHVGQTTYRCGADPPTDRRPGPVFTSAGRPRPGARRKRIGTQLRLG